MYQIWSLKELICECGLLEYQKKVTSVRHIIYVRCFPSRLCKTAQKLFESAEEAREKGDEEYSYVYYMKYLRVIAYISKDKEYLKDKQYFNNMLGAKNPNKAIDAAEKLKNSLIDRWAVPLNVNVVLLLFTVFSL